MTAHNKIDYEALTRDAMRGVVRAVLTQAVRTGLPGDHHFYISFDTQASGVEISKRLKGRYPEEMTIVLQHRFWNLLVGDDSFEVELTFEGILERLVVPFAALKLFWDPSARFGIPFEERETDPAATAPPRGVPMETADTETQAVSGERKGHARKQRPQRVPEAHPVPAPALSEPADAENAAAAQSGAQVVSLDAFRKKS